MPFRQKSHNIILKYLLIHLNIFLSPFYVNAKEIKHSSHLHIADSPALRIRRVKTQNQTKPKLFCMRVVEF